MKARCLALIALLSTTIFPLSAAHAEDELSNFKARVEGAGWLFPTLTLHVVLHEGSHALGAKMMGADYVQITWLPKPGRKERCCALGTTGWVKRGGTTEGERAFVGFAPVITNVATVAAYALLFEFGVPSNEHVRLPLTEVAAWAWADFALELVPYASTHVENVYKYYGLNSWQRIPFRMVHLGLVVLGYHYLRRGQNSIFDHPDDGAVTRETMIPFAMKF